MVLEEALPYYARRNPKFAQVGKPSQMPNLTNSAGI